MQTLADENARLRAENDELARALRMRTAANMRRYARRSSVRAEHADRMRRMRLRVRMGLAALADIYRSLPEPVQTVLWVIAGAAVSLQAYQLLMQGWLAWLI